MSLGRRLLLQLVLATVALAGVAAVGFVGLSQLNQKLSASLAEYDELRWAYEAGLRIARLRQGLELAPATRASARLELAILRKMLDDAPATLPGSRPPTNLNPQFTQPLAPRLDAALDILKSDATDAQAAQLAVGELNAALNVVSSASAGTRRRIGELEAEAQTQRRQVLTAIVIMSAVALTIMLLAGLRHYRAVMGPLQTLAHATGDLAAGNLAARAQVAGDRELTSLATSFNDMAQRLETIHHDLEERVRTRGIQLARSERLASVGLLAASVAHEVNNPLGIIAGQAELALRQCPENQPQTDDQLTQIHQRLTAIRDEAFRCKAITERLMTLARPTPAQRQSLNLAVVVEQVAPLLASEANRRGCTLVCDPLPLPPAGPSVLGDEAQLKQLLINLILNALAATEGTQGSVRVTLSYDEQSALLRVSDDGIGMDASTLEHVFEPFFTTRRGVRQPAAGLGLSVSLAIAQEHGGELTAQSAGPRQGSHFTLRLPLTSQTQITTS